jgi:enamine deaminase RidA (YjgF/YER057c/UK114 family)
MSRAMAKRKSINFPGFSHQNPIPNASRIGNVMMTSVISGVDPGTRNLPPELAQQVSNLFTHIRAAVEAAGGTPDDIIKIDFWMKQPSTGRAALNDEWVKMFPDPASRPARHTLTLGPDSQALVTCAFTAVFS